MKITEQRENVVVLEIENGDKFKVTENGFGTVTVTFFGADARNDEFTISPMLANVMRMGRGSAT